MTDSQRGRVLIVDDEVALKTALCETLAEAGFETVGRETAAGGLKLLKERDFDLLLSDLMMPGTDGIQLLRDALAIDPNLVGIIMTGQGTISTAVEAIKAGAFDYVLKPFDLQTMLPILDRALEVRGLRVENRRLRHYVERLGFESPRYRLVGSGPASGTGKELVARALHHNSRRRPQPLVTLNCAALQETLLESELYGHERGAFTGALRAKAGLIEMAEGGTLFIDEVAEMSSALQAKLLRVLEDGHYRRVGSTKECRADVRVIATNKSLVEEQKAGRFREDLFHRLNVVSIALPPLQLRREDVPELVEHLLTTRPFGTGPWRIDPSALRALQAYDWPGNVRELVNVLERAKILAEGNVITPDDLPDVMRKGSPQTAGIGPFNLIAVEYQTILSALRHTNGNKVLAAQELGISRRTLYRLMDKHVAGEPLPFGENSNGQNSVDDRLCPTGNAGRG